LAIDAAKQGLWWLFAKRSGDLWLGEWYKGRIVVVFFCFEVLKLKSAQVLKFFLVGVFEAGINPPLAGEQKGVEKFRNVRTVQVASLDVCFFIHCSVFGV